MLDLLGLLSKSAPNVHAFTSLDQNPLVYKVKLWHTEALKTANFLKIRIAALSQHVHQLDAGEGGLICLERFEAHHRSTQPNPVALRPILLMKSGTLNMRASPPSAGVYLAKPAFSNDSTLA